MHDSPEWKEVLTKNGWTDAFLTGDEFATYLNDQTKRVEDVLNEAGPGMSEARGGCRHDRRQPPVEHSCACAPSWRCSASSC